MTDKEFANKVIKMAEAEGKSVLVFLADEKTANFHYKVHSLSKNPLVIATMHFLNKQFGDISHSANLQTQIISEENHD
jgi:hypothetical protein